MFLLTWETDSDILWKAIEHGYISSIYEKIMGKILGLNSPRSYGLREGQYRQNLENTNWAKMFNITVIAKKKKKEAKVVWAMCTPSHFSHARLSATIWTVACQAPLSMKSPSMNTGVRCHALSLGIFTTQGSNSVSCIYLLHCRWILYIWATGKPKDHTLAVKQSCI